jgi:hypothetical protein
VSTDSEHGCTEKTTPSSDAEPEEKPVAKDLLLIHGVTSDGAGLEVVRKRNGRVEQGALRQVQEGRPLHGELVRLKPLPEFPLICEVEVQVPARAQQQDVEGGDRERASQHKGPAQVASDRYRRNWDLIWNQGRDKPEPLN